MAGDLAEALRELELQDGAGEVPGIVQGEKLDFEMLQVKYKGVYYVQRLETSLVQRFIDKCAFLTPILDE